MREEKQPCVYILASKLYGTLYIGVTSDLVGRMYQHRNNLKPGHTSKYAIYRLVHFELLSKMEGRFNMQMKVSKKTKKNLPYLEIGVQYEGSSPRIHEVSRVSKPSRRMYMGVKDIKPMKYGKGMYVFSTPKGILRDKDARKEMVGGEVLFSIW